MILIIDTTRPKELRVGLAGRDLKTLRRRFDRPGSYLVPLIDEVIRKARATTNNLTGVIVATGPGPFSSLRAGVSVANALGFALKIPVVGLSGVLTLRQLFQRGGPKLKRAKVGAVILPAYGQPPNISRPKSR